MISRRTLSRLAVLGCLGASLVLGSGHGKAALATTCPMGGPSCTSNPVCVTYCEGLTGYTDGHFCYLHTHCCVCAL
jgi:hypothetical protein